jgi:hypothetical protein
MCGSGFASATDYAAEMCMSSFEQARISTPLAPITLPPGTDLSGVELERDGRVFDLDELAAATPGDLHLRVVWHAGGCNTVWVEATVDSAGLAPLIVVTPNSPALAERQFGHLGVPIYRDVRGEQAAKLGLTYRAGEWQCAEDPVLVGDPASDAGVHWRYVKARYARWGVLGVVDGVVTRNALLQVDRDGLVVDAYELGWPR